MTNNIKGPVGTVFEGYEFVRCERKDGCQKCEARRTSPCLDLFDCSIAAKGSGNWIKIKSSAAPFAPTTPGWYWVCGLATPTRPVYINEHQIEAQMFMDHPFADCTFAPCPLPEGWE